MAVTEILHETQTEARADSTPARLWRATYRLIACVAIVSVFGALLYGFRYDPHASWTNYGFNLALYTIFVAPHLLMTRGSFKRALWGSPEGSPAERRVYILVTIVLWGLVLVFHRPVPGFSYVLPEWIRFLGYLGFLLSLLLFYEGFTFAKLDSLLGTPGAAISYSHGPETPLFTDGQYAQVRHPMYRAALLAGVCALVIHTNAGELLWAVLIGATFIAFIPIEEAQLIAARGDEYRAYMARTPYRLLRGVW
jgi:protein-S-isoprenylcysteine O-methyltransferase Ste14